MNRKMKRNPNQPVTESDLDKLRAFVIRSQRPLQAVRLLEKEKGRKRKNSNLNLEEREADFNFNKQKQIIIEKAQNLEKDKSNFKKEQMEMIDKGILLKISVIFIKDFTETGIYSQEINGQDHQQCYQKKI